MNLERNIILQGFRRLPSALAALAAAPAALAADGAAGMPLRRPRRPTAVSAAFEADADPRPQLHAELDELPPTTDWRGKYPPGGCVGHSVGLPVELGRGIELSSLSALSRAVCACWASGFYQSLSITANGILGVSSPVRASRSVCGFVCACLLARLLPRVAPLIFPSVPSFVLIWAHAVIRIAGVVSLHSLLHHARTAAARSALFAVFGVCGCGVLF